MYIYISYMCAHIPHILYREVRHAHHLAMSSRPERQSEDSSKLISIYDDAECPNFSRIPSHHFHSSPTKWGVNRGMMGQQDGKYLKIPKSLGDMGRYREVYQEYLGIPKSMDKSPWCSPW